jgi:hypothetical protein
VFFEHTYIKKNVLQFIICSVGTNLDNKIYNQTLEISFTIVERLVLSKTKVLVLEVV